MPILYWPRCAAGRIMRLMNHATPVRRLAGLRSRIAAPSLRPVLWLGLIVFSALAALAAGPVEAMTCLAGSL